jgi:hypothetical protein
VLPWRGVAKAAVNLALHTMLAPASHRRADVTALVAYRAGSALFEVSPARMIVWKFLEKGPYPLASS